MKACSMRQARQRLRLSHSAVAMIIVLVVICAAWYVGSLGDGWVGRCLRSRLTLYAGGILLACVVVLYVLVGAAWRLGRAQRESQANSADAGTAAIEFALLFPIALMIVLVMIQSSLLVAGNLAVHHAAYVAARSAVVWVPENLSYGESRNVVGNPGGSAKLHRIHSAAVYAVMPVSAGRPDLGGQAENAVVIREGLRRFHELHNIPVPNWINTMLTGKYQYAWSHTDVSLQPPADGNAYGDHETLRVQVRHTLYLSVPYAGWIFGEPLGESGNNYYGTEVDASCALTNQGVEDEIDVEQFPQYIKY